MRKSRHNHAKFENIELMFQFIKDAPLGVSISDLSKLMHVSARTLLRWLNISIQEGRIERHGRGPSSRYFLKAELNRNKSAVNYQFTFLESYLPNKSFFLSPKDLRELYKIGKPIGYTSFAETYLGHILERLLIDLSWSSSKLEGNTYSLLETEKLLQHKKIPTGKEQIETQMILNHKEAIDFLIRNIQDINLDWSCLRNIHSLLSDGLLGDVSFEGQIRSLAVGIDGSKYVPINIPQILQEQVELFVQKASEIKNPFEQSFFILVFLPYLQPFVDLNKRTARVACNIPFLKHQLSPLSFNEISREEYIQAIIEVYENNDISLLRKIFFRAYVGTAERYRVTKKSLTPPHPFKMKYRQFIQETVAQVVRACVNKIPEISQKEVPLKERRQLRQFIQKELDGLHEGNYAKFRLSPSEYLKWAKKFRS